MSKTVTPRFEELAPSLMARIDALSGEFERSWKSGERPRLEDCLAGVSDAERGPLLEQLLRLEVDYRRKAGESPTEAEYAVRFPEWSAFVRAVFGAEPTPVSGGTVDHASPASGDDDTLDRIEPPLRRYTEYSGPNQGGMGAVWKCRDARLRQWVAVKVLKARLRSLGELRRRFRAEAQLTSQLQHPNIPPVHDVGELPDGRPYYCMRWVEGETLAALLQQTPAAERAAKLLPVFAQVCEALAYAHAQGVIHRDLKPANVMVGAFGEVQVMDWGLAKVLGDAEAVATAWTEQEETQAGAVMGTVAYLPPEQARGDSAAADQRSDVFGLGAILCEILTGSPPYAGNGARERAQAGDVDKAQARLAACGADAGLVTLARDCLQAKAEERPANAGEVARRVRVYQAGVEERLKAAEVEKARATVEAAEQRRRRRLTRMAAGLVMATLLAAVIGITAGMVLAQRKQQEAEGLLERLQDRLLVQILVRKGGCEFTKLVGPLNDIQSRYVSEVIDDYIAMEKKTAADDPASLQRSANISATLGLLYGMLGREEESANWLNRGISRLEKLRDRDPEKFQDTFMLLGQMYSGRADLARLGGQYSEALRFYQLSTDTLYPHRNQESRESGRGSRLLTNYTNCGRILTDMKKFDLAQSKFADAKKLFDQLPENRRNDGILKADWADCLIGWGQLEASLGNFDASDDNYGKAIRELNNLPPCTDLEPREYYLRVYESRSRLRFAQGKELQNKGFDAHHRFGQAFCLADESLVLCRQLAREVPAISEYQQQLVEALAWRSECLAATQRWAEAKRDIQEAIRRAQAAADMNPAIKRLRVRLDSHRERAKQYEKDAPGVKPAPPEPSYYPATVASGLMDHGIALREQGNNALAKDRLHKTLAIWRDLAAAGQPYHMNQVFTVFNLGLCQENTGERALADRSYSEAIRLVRELRRSPGAGPELDWHLANGLTHRGNLRNNAGDYDRAAKDHEEAHDVLKESKRQDALFLATSKLNLGNAIEARRPAEALPWFDRAISELGPIANDNQGNPRERQKAKRSLCFSHWGRARALLGQKKYQEAVAAFEKALNLDDGDRRMLLRAGRLYCLLQLGVTEELQGVRELDFPTTLHVYHLQFVARLYAVAAKKDRERKDEHLANARKFLRLAIDHKASDLEALLTNPDLSDMKETPEFKDLVKLTQTRSETR